MAVEARVWLRGAAARISVWTEHEASSRGIQLAVNEPGIDFRDSFGARTQAFGEPRFRMKRWLVLVPIVGMIGLLFVVAAYRPLDEARFYGIALVLFFLSLFLLSYLAKREKSGDDVRSFFPMTTWLAFGPACVAAVVLVNGALDSSAVEPHTAIVTRKIVSRGKGVSYYLEISSWRPNRSSERVHVSYGVYLQLRINDPVILEVHPGALGIPWIEGVRKAASISRSDTVSCNSRRCDRLC
jgi:hypothetical protein